MGDIAQAQVQALRANRRKTMRGIANQDSAAGGEMFRHQPAHRKGTARAFKRQTSEQEMALRGHVARQQRVVHGTTASRLARVHHPDERGAIGRAGFSRQRHQCERPLSRVKFGGDLAMRPVM